MTMRFAAVLFSAAAIACGAGNKDTGKTALDAQGRPLPVAHGDEGGGVSLTGEHAYDDRHDPSGWSGKTAAPGAVGGGPIPPAQPAPQKTVTPAPSPSATTLPPSKDLDTAPPSKELKF